MEQGDVHLSSPLILMAAPEGVVATCTSIPAGVAAASAALLRLRAMLTRNAMPATATINPRIAPNTNAFFHATGFSAAGFCAGGCGGGVRPLTGLMGGGPTGGVGGTAC